MLPVLFYITGECNLLCCYCKRDNATTDIEKSLELLISLKPEWVFITGGEPTLVPELSDVCKELKRNGIKVGVTTNGTISRTDFLPYIDRLGISIDGDKEKHDSLRGEGTYDKAIAYLKKCKGLVHERIVMTTICDQNFKIVESLESLDTEFIQLTRVNGVEWFSIPSFNNPKIVVINEKKRSARFVKNNVICEAKFNEKELLSGGGPSTLVPDFSYIPSVGLAPMKVKFTDTTKVT